MITAPQPEPPATPRYEELLESARASWWDSENFDKWKSHYLSEHARGRLIVHTLREYLPGFEPNGLRMLDVGCGDAGVAIAFAEAGAEAHGLEPFEPSIVRGRVRAEEHGVAVDLRQGVGEALPFPDAYFDLVVLDNVLEHVDDRERTLDEITRVLRPGGILYLVTPKPFALASLVSDPHYRLAGLVLMPRPVQKWYFERVRGGGEGNYGVGLIPTRRWVSRRLRARGYRLLASPRELWIRYVRDRISRPAEMASPLKTRVAAWTARNRWSTDHPVLAAVWDVAVGSNIFLARKRE